MSYPDADLFRRVPNISQPEHDVLLKHWLPLHVGREATLGYTQLQTSLIEDLLGANILELGPHHADLTDFCTALLHLLHDNVAVVDDVSELPPGQQFWAREFQANMRYTYECSTRPLDLLGMAAITHLPRRFEMTTDGPTLTGHPYKTFSPELLDYPMVNIYWLKIIAGLICLQYAYMDRLVTHPAVMAAGRIVVRRHNALCRQYGLPELTWARDEILGGQ